MQTADLIIRNATIVDGTDQPAFKGDLAVVAGKITEVGRVAGRGREEIDATGAILAPGFIDIHTHFDPQLCWDGLATPSLEHGVTTVVIGNCSLSLAPIKADGQAKMISMFGVIEDIKKPTFDAACRLRGKRFPNISISSVPHSASTSAPWWVIRPSATT